MSINHPSEHQYSLGLQGYPSHWGGAELPACENRYSQTQPEPQGCPRQEGEGGAGEWKLSGLFQFIQRNQREAARLEHTWHQKSSLPQNNFVENSTAKIYPKWFISSATTFAFSFTTHQGIPTGALALEFCVIDLGLCITDLKLCTVTKAME